MGLFRSNSHAVPADHATRRASHAHAVDENDAPGSTFSFSRKETLTTAHTKLRAATAAEKAADEALIASRKAVKSARAEISKLEVEAKREAKAAQIKINTAKKFRTAGEKLGKY